MYSLLCTIFTWSGFHKFTNTHSHSTPLKWSTLSQTKANHVVVLCIDKNFQLNKATEDIFNTFRRGCNYALYRRQTILNKHVRCSRWLVLASFLWDLCTHWRADFVLRAQKRQLQWTVHKTLMSVYTCLVITCKWPTGGHFWLCDRKNHLHMWCLSVSLAPHLSPPLSFFLSPLFDFDHGCIRLHPLGWFLHPCHTKTEPSDASFFSTERRPYQHQVDILLPTL